MNILLSSVGRRPYLVRWFQEALEANGIEGKVIAADYDTYAPSRQFADHFIHAPAVTDSSYTTWLASTLKEQSIDLAVSINDFELSEWAQLDKSPEWSSLVRIDADVQAGIEDKFVMAERFANAGIPTPQTWLGSVPPQNLADKQKLITKGRFGSASRGLQFTDQEGIANAIDNATNAVTDRKGQAAHQQSALLPAELVLVQEMIEGIEYGLDVVCDLNGDYAGVLVRRKIAMRGGETDRAEAVAPTDFEAIARRIAEAVPHPGTIDVDVIVDGEGTPYVIDVNPRFGGGYPLSHLAGARVPNAYVAWSVGKSVTDDWLEYEAGAVVGKYVEAVRVK